MKKYFLFMTVFMLILLVSTSAIAQLITVKELATIIKDDNTIVVSARKPANYKKVHLPGAVNVWHLDLYKSGDVKGLLKSPAEVAAIFGKNGISKDKAIVIYDSGKNIFAGRLYWILKYLGAENVRILDGHMKMWRKGRKPVTSKATVFKAVDFVPAVKSEMMADKAWIKAHKNDAGVVLLDVRSKEEYDGTKGLIKRKGHIPGSVQLNYKNILSASGTIKPKAELSGIFKAAGVTSDKQIVVFCETSVRAGIVELVLSDILGYGNVKIYDGAMYEWAADSTCPME